MKKSWKVLRIILVNEIMVYVYIIINVIDKNII